MLGRRVEVTDSAGATRHLVYRANGTLQSEYSAYGTSDVTRTERLYDLAGRLKSETRGFGESEAATTTYDYDVFGNLAKVTDPNGNAPNFVYDKLGRVVSKPDPMNHVTVYQYDAFGHAIKVTDPKLQSSYAWFDALGRVKATLEAGGFIDQTVYTPFGEVQSTKRFATAYSGAIDLATAPSVASNASADRATQFTYDSASANKIIVTPTLRYS